VVGTRLMRLLEEDEGKFGLFVFREGKRILSLGGDPSFGEELVIFEELNEEMDEASKDNE